METSEARLKAACEDLLIYFERHPSKFSDPNLNSYMEYLKDALNRIKAEGR